MFGNETERGVDLRSVLRAVLVWALVSLILLLITSAVICLADMKASIFPPVSMGIGLISSLFAGAAAAYGTKRQVMLRGLISGLVLTLLLLTLGFLIAGEGLGAVQVLRVSACSIVGCAVGACLRPTGKKLQKRKPFSKKRRAMQLT